MSLEAMLQVATNYYQCALITEHTADLQGVTVNFRAVALFRADGVPVLLQVQIEVFYHPLDPMLTNNDNYFTINLWIPELICDFQELNYSVFIEDADRNILTLLGPIHHRGSGNLHHNIIVSSLEKGQDYVARMYAESTLDNTTSSYSFGK